MSWQSATFLVVILGAAASIVAALDWESGTRKYLLIGLPALSSLLAAILTQFRLKEACRTRELGRIAIEELICEAHLIALDDPKAAITTAIRLRQRAHQIEREQLALFLSESAGVDGRTRARTGRDQGKDGARSPD